jgi:hypothetical protein
MEAVPVRYCKSYKSRHSYTSWRLMFGHNNRCLVALEDGHSVTTMEKTNAAWIKGTKTDDLEKIKAAMGGRQPNGSGGKDGADVAGTRNPPESPEVGTTWHQQANCSRELAGAEGFELRMAGSKPDRRTNGISNLLIPPVFQPPPVPSIPRGWHQSWHQRYR